MENLEIKKEILFKMLNNVAKLNECDMLIYKELSKYEIEIRLSNYKGQMIFIDLLIGNNLLSIELSTYEHILCLNESFKVSFLKSYEFNDKILDIQTTLYKVVKELLKRNNFF